LLVAFVWHQLAARKRTAAWAILVVVLVALGVRTIVRNRDWRDDLSLYTAGLRAEPGSAKMHAAVATQYNARGQFDLARAQYQTALAIYGEYPSALEQYGLLEARTGHDAEALQLLKKALSLSEKGSLDYDYAVVNLAAQLMKLNQNDEALTLLDRDIADSPQYARAWSNRAVLYYQRGQLQAARTDAEMALRLDPQNGQARNVLRLTGEGVTSLAPR
jgi:protein O-mannosyl-transferase